MDGWKRFRLLVCLGVMTTVIVLGGAAMVCESERQAPLGYAACATLSDQGLQYEPRTANLLRTLEDDYLAAKSYVRFRDEDAVRETANGN
jgi:hypothetical protein